MRYMYLWAKLSPDGEVIEDCGMVMHVSTNPDKIYQIIQKEHGYSRETNPIFIAADLHDIPPMESLSIRSMIEAFRYDIYCWGGKTLDECIKREIDSGN